MNAEQSIKDLGFDLAWEHWSPERRRKEVACFEVAVAQLKKQIEEDIYAAGVKPALSNEE